VALPTDGVLGWRYGSGSARSRDVVDSTVRRSRGYPTTHRKYRLRPRGLDATSSAATTTAFANEGPVAAVPFASHVPVRESRSRRFRHVLGPSTNASSMRSIRKRRGEPGDHPRAGLTLWRLAPLMLREPRDVRHAESSPVFWHIPCRPSNSALGSLPQWATYLARRACSRATWSASRTPADAVQFLGSAGRAPARRRRSESQGGRGGLPRSRSKNTRAAPTRASVHSWAVRSARTRSSQPGRVAAFVVRQAVRARP
jgi:hypothetical protein